ncbi:MAG: hypothetical protein KDA37_08595 [Planctomycetales bacterium]|nr:hypothetical protein [Planctomycetales bacterium]
MSRFCKVPRQLLRGATRVRCWAAGLLCGVLLASGVAQGQAIIPLSNLLLNPEDVLPVLVGGTTPGLEHDQYLVFGAAELDGRVDLIFINGYEPALNDEILFIEASAVTRGFKSHFFPVFPSMPAVDAAVQFLQTPTTVSARFVAPTTGNGLAGAPLPAFWFDENTWLQGIPDSRDALVLATDGLPQVIQVTSDPSGQSLPAAVHRLSIQGSANPVLLEIDPGVQFSATQRIDIQSLGQIQLSGGRLISNKIHVEQGGALRMDEGSLVTAVQTLEVAGDFSGTGSITGAVSVLDSGRFEVGLPSGTVIGDISIDGDYLQASQGTLSMDVMSETSGGFDTLAITGQANLSGMLEVDVSGFTSLSEGESIPLITAGAIPGGSRFTKIEPIGLTPNGVYPAVEYTATTASLVGYTVGDMDRDFDRDTDDVDLFAMALIDRQGYEDTLLPNGATIGISADITGDADFDGDMDFDDIDDLLLLLSPPAAAYARHVLLGLTAPEPSAAVLLAIGAALSCRRSRR